MHRSALQHTLFYALLLVALVESSYKDVKIVKNGYCGVVVAINENVKEDNSVIKAIKDLFIEASASLHTATRERAFFKEIIILVPNSWNNGNYEAATKESYEKADIRVKRRLSKESNTPFARGRPKCGTPGEFIQLTTEFVFGGAKMTTNYGPPGNVITHEWAHLRWGVFDEYPIPEKGFPACYLEFDGKGSVEATRCSKHVKGVYTNRYVDKITSKPPKNCSFRPFIQQKTKGLKASLMSHNFIPQLNTFCHNDSSDEVNMHNKDAPTKQNHLCDRKSTWEVILESPDFTNKNLPNPSLDTTPVFKVLKMQVERYAIVMDVSGSMVGEKIQKMNQAVESFINDVAHGSYLGLVKFESTATILSGLQKIDKDSIQGLVNLIPDDGSGGTGIGDGILKGIEVLKEGGTEGAYIIVLTDGEETESPFVADVDNNVIKNGIHMHTVFIATESNNIMKNISRASGGKWYFSQNFDAAASREIFYSISQASSSSSSVENLVLIHSSIVTVIADVEFNDSVQIDNTIGLNTSFSFTWSYAYDPPKIHIKNPKENCVYANYDSSILCNNFTVKTNHRFKTIRFNIDGTAERGTWIFHVLSIYNQKVTSTVTSQPREDVAAIVVHAWVDETEVSNKPAVLRARLSMGSLPIINADVEAIITNSFGDTHTVKLKDNAIGFDDVIDDGMYSAGFLSYEHIGRHSFKVTAHGGQIVRTVTNASPINPETESSTTFEDLDDYKRIGPAESFQVEKVVDSSTLPPGKVIDLHVKQVNLRDYTQGISITFTSPGEDAFEGTASRYELRYSVGDETPNFANDEGTLVTNLLQGNLTTPLESGNNETFVFLLASQDVSKDNSSIKVLFNVKTVDKYGGYSEASNIPGMIYFLKEEALPKINKGFNLRFNVAWVLVGTTIAFRVSVGSL